MEGKKDEYRLSKNKDERKGRQKKESKEVWMKTQ